jgi:hypothetical protein
MNGWQRLWVVVCLVLAILIGWYTYLILPTKTRLTYSHESSIKQLTVQLKDSEGSKYLNDYVASLQEDIRKENENFSKELTELSKERREYFLDSAILWLSVSGSLYVAGWLTGWIYRGFRPKRV